MRSIDHSHHQMKTPFIFTDAVNTIQKASCSQVAAHKVKPVKGQGHIDIKIAGNEVMVTEQCNEGKVMVYVRKLECKRPIIGRMLTRLCSVNFQMTRKLVT